MNRDNEKLEGKFRKLAKLLFNKKKDIDMVCVSVIYSKKMKYNFEDGFKVEGMCLKRKDFEGKLKKGDGK